MEDPESNYDRASRPVAEYWVATLFGLLLICFAIVAPDQATAQSGAAKVADRDLAVDVVYTKSGFRLCGFILGADDEFVSVVVRRQWLGSNEPKFYKAHRERERASLLETANVLKQRISQWKDERKEIEIQEFIELNQPIIDSLTDAEASVELPFTIVKLPRKQVRKVRTKTDERRNLVGIGWSLGLDDVESQSAEGMQNAIEARNIDIGTYEVDLSEKVPWIMESDEAWELRKSIVEHALLDRLEFQGVNGMFIPRNGGGGTAGQMMNMLRPLMSARTSMLDQLGKELDLPEFRDRNRNRKRWRREPEQTRKKAQKETWLDPLIQSAEAAGKRSFSVAKLEQGDEVSVEAMLFCKGADGDWKMIKKVTAKQGTKDQNADEFDDLKRDPQVAAVLDMATQMGMSDPSTVEKALRQGVATNKALSEATSGLNQFINSFANRIDSPVVPKTGK